MTTKTNTPSSFFDFIKWIVAIAILATGIVGFYYFENESLLLRVVALLAFAGIAAFIASTTLKGRNTVDFFRETNIEVRKVVWPSRQETIQTTAIVMFMVILVALMIWALDSTLFWVVSLLTGPKGS